MLALLAAAPAPAPVPAPVPVPPAADAVRRPTGCDAADGALALGVDAFDQARTGGTMGGCALSPATRPPLSR